MIELSTTPLAAVLAVVGDLDLVEREAFPDLLVKVHAVRRPLLVVDACRMTHLDPAGAGLLATLAQDARERGGQAVLRGLAERDRHVLELVGALDLFRVDAQHRCAPGTGNGWEAAIGGGGR